MYNREDLQITDAISHIREHPEFYLPDGYVSGSTVLCRIVADILVATSACVFAQRLGDWWVIGSDRDWLRPRPNMTGREYFSELVPFPEAGQNSFHAEVLLAAFARDIVVLDNTSHFVYKGQLAPTDAIFTLQGKRSDVKRMIAFRM